MSRHLLMDVFNLPRFARDRFPITIWIFLLRRHDLINRPQTVLAKGLAPVSDVGELPRSLGCGLNRTDAKFATASVSPTTNLPPIPPIPSARLFAVRYARQSS